MKQEEEYIGLPNEVVNPSVVVKAEQHSEEEEEEEEEPLEEEEEEEPQEEEEQEQQRFHHQPHTGDGASPGKIFIGGLAKETTPVQFNKHFGKYGEITDSVIMKDRRSGQPRGFGFVTYADPAVVDKVIEETHVINGKQVEIKRTIPKGSAGSRDIKTKKIFVGGIPTSVAEDEFKDFFAKYGEVKEHMIMRDHATNRSRGFGFITFETEESVDDLLSKGNRIDLAGTQVEIKKAEPKKANPPPPPAKRFNDSRPAYGAVFGDSYGGYGGGAAAAGSGYGASSYRSGGGRPGAYGGYGGSEYGGAYGGYGGSGLGGYNRGEPPLGYASRYGGSYGRGYDLGGTYGGAGEGYGGYGGASVGGFGGTGTGTGTGTGAYDTSLGSGYGGGTGGSFYGSRGGYGGAAGRYHPYGR